MVLLVTSEVMARTRTTPKKKKEDVEEKNSGLETQPPNAEDVESKASSGQQKMETRSATQEAEPDDKIDSDQEGTSQPSFVVPLKKSLM